MDFGSGNIALGLDVDFPSNVYAGPGVAIDKTGATWTIGLGYPPLSENVHVTPTNNYYLAVYDVAQALYEKVRLDNLIASATGLDTRTAIGDANYIATSADRYIAISTPLTLNRTLSLPAAATVPGGREIVIQDEIGTLSSNHALIVQPTGGDRIDGYSSRVIATAYGGIKLRSDGVARWSFIATTSVTPVGDTNYTCNSDDKVIAITALTAPRTVTLPLAAGYQPGQRLVVMDQAGVCTTGNTVTVLPVGGDFINGLTASPALNAAHAFLGFVSNGINAWTVVDNVGGGGGPVSVTSSQITDASPLGRLLLTQATAAQDRASLGSQPTGDALFLASTPAGGRAVLQSGVVGDAVFISSTTGAAGSALGLGSMAYQNSNNVTITGGTITGVAGLGGASITMSDTPPGSPTNGALWYDTTAAQLYVWYNDGTSSQWVVTNNQNLSGIYLPLTGGTVSGPVTFNGAATIKSGTIDSTVIGGTTPAAASFTSMNGGQLAGLRNKIINGDFRVDQYSNHVSAFSLNYFCDRWAGIQSATAWNFSCPPSSAPVAGLAALGFAYCARAYVVTPAAPPAGNTYTLQQRIEGLNIADLAWGTAGAKPVTLSFWALATTAGTYSGAIQNGAFNRSYPFTYSIPAANTWTYCKVTIPGDTTGTWAIDNSLGLIIYFDLGSGATYRGPAGVWAASNVVGVTGAASLTNTAGANFYLVGVQLEAGSIATPFEQRPIGLEQNLCQRYYWDPAFGGTASGCFQLAIYSSGAGLQTATMLTLPQTMRGSPTITVRNFSGNGATAIGVSPSSWGTLYCNITATGAQGISALFNMSASAEL